MGSEIIFDPYHGFPLVTRGFIPTPSSEGYKPSKAPRDQCNKRGPHSTDLMPLHPQALLARRPACAPPPCHFGRLENEPQCQLARAGPACPTRAEKARYISLSRNAPERCARIG